jgi:hypothetical protein
MGMRILTIQLAKRTASTSIVLTWLLCLSCVYDKHPESIPSMVEIKDDRTAQIFGREYYRYDFDYPDNWPDHLVLPSLSYVRNGNDVISNNISEKYLDKRVAITIEDGHVEYLNGTIDFVSLHDQEFIMDHFQQVFETQYVLRYINNPYLYMEVIYRKPEQKNIPVWHITIRSLPVHLVGNSSATYYLIWVRKFDTEDSYAKYIRCFSASWFQRYQQQMEQS